MKTTTTLIGLGILFGLTGCIDNTAIGNDREAQIDPPEPPAEMAPPESLAQIDPGLLKPQPIREADLASLRGSEALCRFRYTEVGFPVFLYPAAGDASAIIKLNGKLIPLPSAGESYAYAGGPVRALMRHPDGVPLAGEEEAVLILRLDGASGELGFAGEAECP